MFSNFNISLQWDADGVATYKSSKVSMCPIQVAINELPYRVRNDNIILASLWCATEKPVMDLYLKPFVDELRDLHENGIELWPPGFDEPITVKVHTVLAPVDSVERCSLQNVHQYNGEFGCSYCLHRGEYVPVGNGHARVYCGEEGIPRSKEQHARDAEKAVTETRIVNGVKGVSMLMLVPNFDIISGLPPEYMHSGLLGAVRTIGLGWFDPKNANCGWYLGREKGIIDERLTSICPPCEITRVPRSINNMKLWKASEWKNFLLYYSLPCLNNLLPAQYYKHWSLFVFAMHIYLADEIHDIQHQQAEIAIRKFVADVERLYGKEFMKFNIHLMLHIPRFVKFFGALWAWSAFPFEGYNHVLRKMLHSSQSAMTQICKSYLRLQSIKNNNVFERENCSQDGQELYLHMLGDYKIKSCLMYGENLRIFKPENVIFLTILQKVSIQALVNENVKGNAMSYERFIYKNILYHSCDYKRLYKRNNSIIQTSSGTFMTITNILSISTATNGITKYVVIGRSLRIIDENLCVHNNILLASYLFVVRLTNNIVTCYPEHIFRKCVIIPYNDATSIIIPLVNMKETD